MEHEFGKISNPKVFKRKVPVMEYEGYEKWLIRIMNGEDSVLTQEPVSILEPTSGSTAGTKLIPYTKSLQKDFLKGIRPWIFDLILKGETFRGSAYWSITPFQKTDIQTKSQIAIGFKNDSEYFGNLEQMIIGRILSVPSEVCEISEIENFRYATIIFLVSDRLISFISIWNPTFLSIMLKYMLEWKEQIVEDIRFGRITFPKKMNALLAKRLEDKLEPNEERARELAIAFEGIEEKLNFSLIWPNLSIISCWADGNSLSYAEKIAEFFPDVIVQPKGLLATEAIISFPFIGKRGSLLSVRSHFFEFIEQKEVNLGEQEIKLAHQLEIGKRYSVVVTTGGGLYRYQIGDIVEIVGFYLSCPLIRFVCRSNNVSDLFGEKVNEKFLEMILKLNFEKYSIKTKFFMIAPDENEIGQIAYTLFIEFGKNENISKINFLCEDLEKSLHENFHYSYCRSLGQLNSFQVFLIEKSGEEDYINHCVSNGQRLGDIKMPILRKELDWSKVFRGNFIS